MKLPKVLAALLSLSLTACGNTTAIREGTADQMCKSWGEIRPSRKDTLTPDTARQISGNNAAHAEWCPQKPAKVASSNP